MRKIRRQLVDINWNDFMTWKYIWSEWISEDTVEHYKRTKKEFEQKEVINNKINIKWLWLVSV